MAALLKRENIISDEGTCLIEKNNIDGQALLLLETEDFKEIGIVALGDRVKLKKFISTHRPATASPAAQTDLQSVSTNYYEVNASIFYMKGLQAEDPAITESDDEAVDPLCTVSRAL